MDNITGLEGTDGVGRRSRRPHAAAARGRTHHALGLDRLRRAHRKGDGRAGADVATSRKARRASSRRIVLLANPNATANDATVTFLREGGAAPVTAVFDAGADLAQDGVRGRRFRSCVISRSASTSCSTRRAWRSARCTSVTRSVQTRATNRRASTRQPRHGSSRKAPRARSSRRSCWWRIRATVDATVDAHVSCRATRPADHQDAARCAARRAGRCNIATEDRVARERGGGHAHRRRRSRWSPRRAQYWPFTPDQLVRSAQQLRRHVARPQVGPRRRPRRHGGELSDLHPAGEPEHDDGGGGDGDVPADERHDRGRRTSRCRPTSRFNVEVHAAAELANESFGTLIEVTDGGAASRSSGRCIRTRPASCGRRARTHSARWACP